MFCHFLLRSSSSHELRIFCLSKTIQNPHSYHKFASKNLFSTHIDSSSFSQSHLFNGSVIEVISAKLLTTHTRRRRNIRSAAIVAYSWTTRNYKGEIEKKRSKIYTVETCENIQKSRDRRDEV